MAEVVDTYGDFELIKNDDGTFEAHADSFYYAGNIAVKEDCYNIVLNDVITGYDDFERFQDETELAIDAGEYFVRRIDHLTN